MKKQVRKIPAPMPAPSGQELEKPSKTKSIRDWAAISMSAIALAVSILGYFNSRTSTMLSQYQFNADRAIILVGDKLDEQPKGMMFRFHALSATQHLSKLMITVPSVFQNRSWKASPPDQKLSLFPIETKVGEYYLSKFGRKFGYARVLEPNIPVILDAWYSVAGESAARRGLYLLDGTVLINDDKNQLPDVDFKDFSFVQELDFNADPQKLIDEAWKEKPELTIQK
jgi:hypothetical protein